MLELIFVQLVLNFFFREMCFAEKESMFVKSRTISVDFAFLLCFNRILPNLWKDQMIVRITKFFFITKFAISLHAGVINFSVVVVNVHGIIILLGSG